MKEQVLDAGFWVLGFTSNCFFMIRCVRQDMGVIFRYLFESDGKGLYQPRTGAA